MGDRRSMKTETIINPLGGSGKTTTTLALGKGLCEKGYKVLLVDLGFDRTLTYMVSGMMGIDFRKLSISLCDVFRGNATIAQAIHSMKPGLDIVVGGLELGEADAIFSQPDKECMLREQLEQIQAMYDYCIIDTDSHFNLMTANALAASDSVIIPLPDYNYIEGALTGVKEVIDHVAKDFNPKLEIGGLLVVSPYTTFSQASLLQIEGMAKEMGTKVFRTKIHFLLRDMEIMTHDYRDFVNEFLEQS